MNEPKCRHWIKDSLGGDCSNQPHKAIVHCGGTTSAHCYEAPTVFGTPSPPKSLVLKPTTLKEANALVGALHRHHGKTVGHKFSIGVTDETGTLVGAVIVGRPVARKSDNGYTAEVTRLVTDGSRNACSILYAAAARAAKAMGYRRIQTFILESEPGTSLKASGWVQDGMTSGGSWSVPSRPRQDKHPLVRKQRWAKEL